MQIKTKIRFQLTAVRMVRIKVNNNNTTGENVAKKEPLYTAGGNGN
jgi:hypothetical protein